MYSISFKKMAELYGKVKNKYSSIVGFLPTGWTTFSYQHSGSLSIYGVTYSEHSSFWELKSFVDWIKPLTIIPTVNCHSSEKIQWMLNLLTSDRIEEPAFSIPVVTPETFKCKPSKRRKSDPLPSSQHKPITSYFQTPRHSLYDEQDFPFLFENELEVFQQEQVTLTVVDTSIIVDSVKNVPIKDEVHKDREPNTSPVDVDVEEKKIHPEEKTTEKNFSENIVMTEEEWVDLDAIDIKQQIQILESFQQTKSNQVSQKGTKRSKNSLPKAKSVRPRSLSLSTTDDKQKTLKSFFSFSRISSEIHKV